MTDPVTETVCAVRWATDSRQLALASAGLPATRFHALGVGPVIFRAEADYLREVQAGDRVGNEAIPRATDFEWLAPGSRPPVAAR